MSKPSTDLGSMVRRLWPLLVISALVAVPLAAGAAVCLHLFFAMGAGIGIVDSARWALGAWLVLVGSAWLIVLAVAYRRRASLLVLLGLSAVVVLCAGLPAGTWWTYAVDHSRGHGAQYDTLAVNEFFSSAFSKYREPLTVEGEVAILSYVQPKHRKQVMAQVRQIRNILERPVPGENPPADKQWQRTTVILEIAARLSTTGNRLVWDVAAETTYPIDHFPWWGNQRSSGAPWAFTVQQDDDGGWWVTGFEHPDICTAYLYSTAC